MASRSEFHDYIVYDVLSGVSGITSRKMFGGAGIYKDGIFFAIISGDVLYFRTNEKTCELFKRHGSEPFSYTKHGKKAVLKNYWRVPDEIIEDREKMIEWAEDAAASRHL